ncbi:MAG: alpha/beta hydrolase, partial [Bryobacteraceae bacterium]|nr:alpha/beta hydrolase [Bryobacteraceae bacterium]
MKLSRWLLTLQIFAAVAAGVEIRNDIEFSRPSGHALTMDAHIPEGPGPFAAVILVHGGGWEAGDKRAAFIQPLFEPLDKSGLAWFSIDYRLAPKDPYPAAVLDVEEAIRYVKGHAREFRVDPARLALMGESAGGHLVALVATRSKAGTSVAAVVPFYGVFDFESLVESRGVARAFKNFLGISDLSEKSRAILREASASTFVKPGLPPFLLIHGTQDTAVPYGQSVKFCAQLKSAGVPCDFYTVDDGIHGVMNWEKKPAQHGYKKVMLDWLRKTLDVKPEGRTVRSIVWKIVPPAAHQDIRNLLARGDVDLQV